MPIRPQPRVTVVVTQRESFLHTQRSLESLYATTQIPFALVYVDGGSPAKTRTFLQGQAVRRGFTLVRRDRFLVPNVARNLGFDLVDTELVVFAENDVLFRAGWLEALVAAADEEGAAVVGPLIYFREPEFTIVHSVGGATHLQPTPTGNSYANVQKFREMSIEAIPARFERERVDFVEFHCLLARAETVRAHGPFDENLSTCLEFDDFCLQVKRAGGVIVNEPAAVVQHLLPLAPPRGLGDWRFLRARWSPRGNAQSVEHFRRKWNVRVDDPYLRGMAAWCNARPMTVIANTRTFKAMRAVKRFVMGAAGRSVRGLRSAGRGRPS